MDRRLSLLLVADLESSSAAPAFASEAVAYFADWLLPSRGSSTGIGGGFLTSDGNFSALREFLTYGTASMGDCMHSVSEQRRATSHSNLPAGPSRSLE